MRQQQILRTGFILFFALLTFVMVSALTIQEKYARQAVELHFRYVEHQKATTDIRRILWSSGLQVRDYFFARHVNAEPIYLREIPRYETAVEKQLKTLRRVGAPPELVDDLQNRFKDWWGTLASVKKQEIDNAAEYDFLQQEIIPKREAAGAILRELEQLAEEGARQSTVEFEASRANASKLLWLLFAASIGLGLVGVAVSLRHSSRLEAENQAKFIQVTEAQKELEQLSARLMAIQEEERIRLSRELHDEVVQTLAVSKMEVLQAQQKTADSPKVLEHLTRARNMLESSLQTIRNLALLLRPSILDDLGLVPALQWQAQEFERRTGIDCQVIECDLPEEIEEETKTCVYRVVQEALRNCEKHAGTSRVQIGLSCKNDMLGVEIRDFGRGFHPNLLGGARTGQLGLLGMRERASAIHGCLTIDSAPGRGTAVTLEVPLASRQHSPAGVHKVGV
ncbi:MAG TPA: sensor histidine kinase [Bryobacteraceae bacterium]|nr:sensor histidine kinase [Bryobacteraceae bacterium]